MSEFTVEFKPYLICTFFDNVDIKQYTKNKYLDLFDYQMFILKNNIKLNGFICDILYPFELEYNPIVNYPDITIECKIKTTKEELDEYFINKTKFINFKQYLEDYLIETYGKYKKNEKPIIPDKAVDTWLCGDIEILIIKDGEDEYVYEFGLCFIGIN